MKREQKKLPLYLKVPASLVGLCVLLSMALPTTGPLVLVEEGCSLVLMILLLGGLVWALPSLLHSRQIPRFLLVLAVTALLGWAVVRGTGNLLWDITEGPQLVSLHSCQVDHTSGTRGIFSLRYTLEGVDREGTEYRLKISGADYNRLQKKSSVTALCYPHTGRTVEVS